MQIPFQLGLVVKPDVFNIAVIPVNLSVNVSLIGLSVSGELNVIVPVPFDGSKTTVESIDVNADSWEAGISLVISLAPLDNLYRKVAVSVPVFVK